MGAILRVIMSRYKVLKLPSYLTRSKEQFKTERTLDWLKDLGKAETIFNRDGYYYDRITKKCWVESSVYGSWYHDPGMFLHTLENLSHKLLTYRELFAIKEMVRLNIFPKLNKQLNHKLYVDTRYKELLSIRNKGRIYLHRFKKEFF